MCDRVVRVAMGVALTLAVSVSAFAQAESNAVTLSIAAGRPVRVALDRTIRVTGVGQTVSATVVEPVYAHDRVVLPAGTPVLGHVVRLVNQTKKARLRAMLSGDFSPTRRVVLTFDTIVVDGRQVPVETVAQNGTERLRRQVAPGPEPKGLLSRAEQAVKERVGASIGEPGKLDRLKEAALRRLPYHPQLLHKGTVYDAVMQSAVQFETVTPLKRALAGATPAPDSILTARLVTPLNSSTASRGGAVTAIVTEPVFSADHELILAEGATLEGEVTFAQPARRWHRNGQLRFIVDRVRPVASQDAISMQASLYSVDVSQDAHVAIDDEGGAAVTNSKTRFIAPALAVLALRGSIDQHRRRFDDDGDAYDLAGIPAPPARHPGARAVGGLLGFGVLGAALSQVSRPVAIAFAGVGAARTLYRNVVGKGDDVSFGADTPIQVRLAPGKSDK